MSSCIWERAFCFAILVILLVPQQSMSSGVVTGKVTDVRTKRPLIGANVQIIGTLQGASTDPNGYFEIRSVPVGIYSIRISMMGYRTRVLKGIRVLDGEITRLTISLEQAPIQFDPIVVLASRMRQELDRAPVSICVVVTEEIKRRNPRDLVQVLETVPGIHFIGNQINIRGSTGFNFGAGNKVLLLVDGVPVYASDTGEFNWDMLPPLDIQQIEVLKGAGSTLWGASALGGVINIITKSPTSKGQLLFSCTLGKYDKPYYKEWYWTDHNRLYYNREDISYSRRFGPLGMRISAGRFVSTGYTQLGDFRKYNLTGKFEYHFPKGVKWTVYSAYSWIDRGFFIQWKSQNDPYEVDESALGNRAKINQLNIYTKLTLPLSPKFAISLRGSYIRTLMGTHFGEPGSFNPALGQGGELQGNWIPHKNHSITFGVQYQQDAGSAKYFGNHKGYFIGSYLQDEWRPREDFRVTAGFRYDRYQLKAGLKEDLLSPRLGINWHPFLNTSLRASVGSGFRAATIVERFLELSIMNFKIISNPSLKAESSWAYEVGLRQYITKNWNIDVAFFDNEYWELIEAHLDLIRGWLRFRNIPRARIRGIEAITNLSFPITLFGVRMTPGLQANVTAMNHKDLKTKEPLAYRPCLLATIKSSLGIGPAQIQVDYRYASKIDEVKIYPINDRVPMRFLDAYLSLNLGSLMVQLGCNNILQYNYAPMESNLEPMRTFTVGLTGEF